MADIRTFPHTFIVQRNEDVTGISGEGIVAEGVCFSDGWAVTHWLDRPPMNEPKTEVWHNPGTEPFEKISGHGGRTHIVWADEDQAHGKLAADVAEASDVPGGVVGPEGEREVLRRRIKRAIQSVQDGEAAPVEAGDDRIVQAVMPIIERLQQERDRARAAAVRAYRLADRWEAAHGSAMFLVRVAGAELRYELGGDEFESPSVLPALTEAIRYQDATTARAQRSPGRTDGSGEDSTQPPRHRTGSHSRATR
ncbi:hypothetical protein [Streptomyces sp. NPDC056160]|uniref:hypothetical protein n=1 Tax=Streptomyces sp. NPDC056160 TaxID=3345731 RepID=UPI0035DEB686